jgi:Domain of unknown function (DUF1996)
VEAHSRAYEAARVQQQGPSGDEPSTAIVLDVGRHRVGGCPLPLGGEEGAMLRRLTFVLAVLCLIGLTANPAEGTVTSIHFFCKFSHGPLAADPIVSPGMPSMHTHLFFGNMTTNQDSTYQTMVGASSTCRQAGDTAAYWVPALLDANGNPVPISGATVYYGNEPSGTAVAFPPDFRLVAGYPHAFSSKPNSFWGWSCDNSDPLSPTITGIDCSKYAGTASGYISARIFFPECAISSTATDAADHRSHTSYPYRNGVEVRTGGSCPADHPVNMPRVRLIVRWKVVTCPGCYLSSDWQYGTPAGGSLHADYWNTWNQPALESMVAQLNGSPPSPQPSVSMSPTPTLTMLGGSSVTPAASASPSADESPSMAASSSPSATISPSP